MGIIRIAKYRWLYFYFYRIIEISEAFIRIIEKFKELENLIQNSNHYYLFQSSIKLFLSYQEPDSEYLLIVSLFSVQNPFSKFILHIALPYYGHFITNDYNKPLWFKFYSILCLFSTLAKSVYVVTQIKAIFIL